MFWRTRKEADFNEKAQADMAFKGVSKAHERHDGPGRGLWLEHLQRDLKYALRALYRSPGFTVVAVVSLALGIGVNALIFSVVNALVLRPLPIERPSELAFLEIADNR